MIKNEILLTIKIQSSLKNDCQLNRLVKSQSSAIAQNENVGLSSD